VKFNCGLSAEEKRKLRWEQYKAYQEVYDAGGGWVDWFAWYPVRVAPRDCRWLEKIEVREGRPAIGSLSALSVLPSLYLECRAKATDGA
jgi:hypothetical protein